LGLRGKVSGPYQIAANGRRKEYAKKNPAAKRAGQLPERDIYPGSLNEHPPAEKTQDMGKRQGQETEQKEKRPAPFICPARVLRSILLSLNNKKSNKTLTSSLSDKYSIFLSLGIYIQLSPVSLR
jgi:hypothetical protein